MPKLIATHEVNDVAHWLASTKRAEVFASAATDIRTFVDPQNPNRVGLSMDVADMDAFQAIMQSDEGAAAMQYDGVRPETLVILVEKLRRATRRVVRGGTRRRRRAPARRPTS